MRTVQKLMTATKKQPGNKIGGGGAGEGQCEKALSSWRKGGSQAIPVVASMKVEEEAREIQAGS